MTNLTPLQDGSGMTTLETPQSAPTTAQKRATTLAARRTDPRFRIGDQIRCERVGRSRGSWPRWDGRSGTVVAINDGEIGVAFVGDKAADPTAIRPADAWFLPTELVHVGGAR